MALGWRRDYLRYKNYFLNIVTVYKKRKDLKMFLEILLSLSTISFFTIFAIRPTFLTIAELVKKIRTKEETVNKMDTKIQNLDQALVLYTQEQARIALLESAVPSSAAPDVLVRQIEGVATTHPVSLLGLSTGDVTLVGEEKVQRKSGELGVLPGGAKELSFSISLTGDFQNIASFLETLENLRRPVKIDVATINSSETEEARIIVLVVSGRTPYLKESPK